MTPALEIRGLAFPPDDRLLYAKLRPLEYLEFVRGTVGP